MAKAPVTTTDTSAAALSAALIAPAPEKDEFHDAFAGFTAKSDPVLEAANAMVAEAAAAKEGEVAAEAVEPATEIEGVPAAGAEGETKVEEPEVKVEVKAEEKDDPVARIADYITKREAERKPEPKAEPQPAATPPLFTTGEIEKVQAFYKEWPDVAEAQAILFKGIRAEITQAIYADMAKVIGPKFALLDQMANAMQYDKVKQEVPDLTPELEAKIAAWVQSDDVPAYLRPAFTNVIENGLPSEIKDLVKRYRVETGDAATVETQAPTKVATLSTAAKKAVAALAPVTSKQTGSVQSEPVTFEDMFAKLTAAKAG